MSDCTFCGIVAGRKTARVVREWPDMIAFRDKRELVPDGHILIVPREHITDVRESPALAGRMMVCTAQLAREFEYATIINTVGAAGGQSEFHAHMHLLRRAPQDGLLVPWGTVGNPHAPHACTRALAAEDQLAEMAASLEALDVLTDILRNP